jgi:hypothetical protein
VTADPQVIAEQLEVVTKRLLALGGEEWVSGEVVAKEAGFNPDDGDLRLGFLEAKKRGYIDVGLWPGVGTKLPERIYAP